MSASCVKYLSKYFSKSQKNPRIFDFVQTLVPGALHISLCKIDVQPSRLTCFGLSADHTSESSSPFFSQKRLQLHQASKDLSKPFRLVAIVSRDQYISSWTPHLPQFALQNGRYQDSNISLQGLGPYLSLTKKASNRLTFTLSEHNTLSSTFADKQYKYK